MTHYSAETLEEVTHEELAERYEHYLDEVLHPDGVSIDGVELIPSEVLKEADPNGYEEGVHNYINLLYDSEELTSEWDRAERIKELLVDWAFMELASLVDHTTTEQDKTVNAELYKLYEQGVLTLDNGEIELSDQHTMLDVISALVIALNENKTNE